MSGRWGNLVPGDQHPLRHGLAFLICGFISLCVDAVILKLLTVLLGLHPFVARIAAIMVAMMSGWLSHRTFTFALKTPPTVAEFLRYVAVGWFVSAINYGVFVDHPARARRHRAADRAARLLDRGHVLCLLRHARRGLQSRRHRFDALVRRADFAAATA